MVDSEHFSEYCTVILKLGEAVSDLCRLYRVSSRKQSAESWQYDCNSPTRKNYYRFVAHIPPTVEVK